MAIKVKLYRNFNRLRCPARYVYVRFFAANQQQIPLAVAIQLPPLRPLTTMFKCLYPSIAAFLRALRPGTQDKAYRQP
jgi:hypothetical protein